MLIFSVFFFGYYLISSLENKRSYSENKSIKPTTDSTMLDSVLLFIMDHEGFSDTVYLCPSGNRTIGYGHLLKNNEYCIRVDKSAAYSLLKKDFFERLNVVKGKKFKINYYQTLAIAHFVYCLGESRLEKMQKHIEMGDVDSYLMRFNKFYTKDSILIESKNLTKQRQFEKQLFNKQ